ncbi:MAG TPA: FAD-dependent oxidoreductase [Pyrinomonadaceae bacterium]|nr:FAD-dependent oxidoreductase [Pyrinomonadaceae bacterium]
MTETADVVIVGGGIVGASIAYHLTSDGCRDVLIVERAAQQGTGSTGRATGGVRAQFETDINVRMSLHSIDFFARFREEIGRECGYRAVGYLFFATSDELLARLDANRERQRAAGLRNVRLLTREEVGEMLPQMRLEDVRGGVFCPTDGLIDPPAVMRGLTEAATEHGARVWTDARVTSIETEDGRVASVETSRGRVSTRVVVNAAGAWAGEVARLAGLELPIVPLRRQLVGVEGFAGMSESMPMVIDAASGFHFRRVEREGRTAAVLLAWPDPAETPGFREEFDDRFVAKVSALASARVPSLAGAAVDRSLCRAGLYEMTPDRHAVLGEAPAPRGLFLACGFSGHGVMHAPATGRITSDLIMRGRTELVDVEQLGVERFAAGRLIEAEHALL